MIKVNKGSITDLHAHSSFSDGVDGPIAIVDAAIDGGLKYLAITDHYTTGALKPAIERVQHRKSKLIIIPGVEVSTSDLDPKHDIKGLHILGYGMNNTSELDASMSQWANNNKMMYINMVHKLEEEFGITLFPKSVLESLIADHINPFGRKQIAEALAIARITKTPEEAYYQIVGPYGSLGVKKDRPTAKKAICMLNEAGGEAYTAHPWHWTWRDMHKRLTLDEIDEQMGVLKSYGLRGTEGFSTRPEKASDPKYKTIQSIAANHRLDLVGGSDRHGNDGKNLGNPQVWQQHIDAMFDALWQRRRLMGEEGKYKKNNLNTM